MFGAVDRRGTEAICTGIGSIEQRLPNSFGGFLERCHVDPHHQKRTLDSDIFPLNFERYGKLSRRISDQTILDQAKKFGVVIGTGT